MHIRSPETDNCPSWISNWSNTAYLKMKAGMLFFTMKHCPIFTLTKGYGAGVKVGKCMHMFFWFFFLFCFFLQFDPTFFLSFSLSFPPFSFAFSCTFHMLGHLSHAWLVLMGLHYEGTMVNWTFLIRQFDHFFLTLEAFSTLPLHARVFIL